MQRVDETEPKAPQENVAADFYRLPMMRDSDARDSLFALDDFLVGEGGVEN